LAARGGVEPKPSAPKAPTIST